MKNDNTKSILIKVITVAMFFAIAMIIVFIMNSLDHDESQLLQSTEATTEDTLIVEIPDEEKTTEAVITEAEVIEDSGVSEDNSDEPMEIQESTKPDDEPEVSSEENTSEDGDVSAVETPVYVFRKQKLLDQHYQKHGIEMGFKSAEDYEKAASAVVTNPKALHKTESEDGDDCYYLEDTNEFVVVSTDGYLRTYFKPDRGKAYFDKQ
jgi:pyocin large subunit-like protein